MINSNLKENLKNKYIFLDLDSTLSQYRYNDNVNDQQLDQILFDDVFYRARSLQKMIDFFKDFDRNNLYILSAEYINWLNMYYAYIKKQNVIFICQS